ncbi:adenosylcobinamide-GDP ribazoletransferase [Haloactinospora alba]|nr:adenosylcobinamide-GDP ribazoletransferase [Haloactinospora alba]
MALGTFTVIPVRVRRVDRGVAGWAMVLAPAAGAVLGAVAAALLLAAVGAGLSAPLSAALVVGCLALLTRGLHLDGVADLADGLGSARPAGEALDVMKRSDIGPFGVVTLVTVVLVQTLALGQVAGASPPAGAVSVLLAVLTGRLAVTWACTPRVPAARPEGLGVMVAGTVPVRGAAVATVATLAVASLGTVVGPGFALGCALAVVAGLAVAGAVLWHALRRLGGVTGDVLGALSEVVTTVVLVGTAAAV